MKKHVSGQLSMQDLGLLPPEQTGSPPLRRHIPRGEISEMRILSFPESLAAAEEEQADYDVHRWLFVPPVYTEYRYILGTRGRDPLICIGINPSTARPDRLDPTLQSVERIALHNGFDSFLMLNLCAQRATDPDDMTRSYPDALRQGNIDAFLYALGRSERPTVWCAWGTLIEKRPFIADLLRDLVRAAGDRQPAWVSAGPKSKKGHPHHPLYLRSDAVTEPFDMDAYLASLK